MENNDFNGSANAGSPIANNVPNANNLGGASGQTSQQTPPAVTIDPEQHKELESLVGRQGAELGEFRKFFSDIQPLLDNLDKNPEVVQAIMDGKITADLAKAALEGKVSIADAQIVSQAHQEVKKELGKKYEGASSEDVSRLVEEKAKELKADFDSKLKERDDLAAFEASVAQFISNTPDFNKYSSEINKWLDEHDVTDISVAYYAVKGKLSEEEAKKQAEIDKVEAEKNGALNMGGGSGNATRIRGDENIVDSLIAPKTNPNIFG